MAGKSIGLMRGRLFLLVGCLLFWSALVGYRLFSLQVFQHEELRQKAIRQSSRSFKISPRRGTIYDRQRRELAISIQVDSIFAVPVEIRDKRTTAARLASALKLKREELLHRLSSNSSFVWIKRKVDYQESLQVRNLDMEGVHFQKESKRFYPKRELAAHVLGFVGMDNEGLSGVEAYYDRWIKGEAGRVLLNTDARQQSFRSWEESPPTAGQDLVLTIDEYIQFVVEQELSAQVEKAQARGGTAVVINPRTGEILAMASYPTYNPNQFRQYSPECLNNQAVWNVYEPGSTFKIITAGTVLNEKLAYPGEVINCNNGSIQVGGHKIRDHKPYGDLTVSEVVANSSNVGIIKLGLRLNREKFARYISDFGFGTRTGVDLPREENGLVPDWRKWPQVTHATISMGQGIGVTSLQILKAICSVANGGTLVQPHLLHESSSSQIQRVQYQPGTSPQQIFRPQVTTQLKGMMRDVLTDGTGKSAQLEGYSAAGKTGTSQKTERAGGYSHSRFIASFAGFAPLEHPVIAAVITIDEPKGLYYGGEVAAPVFRAIAQKTLQYLAIAPDQPLTPDQLARLRRRQMEQAASEAVPSLESAELKPEFSLASYTPPPALPGEEMESDPDKTEPPPLNPLFPGMEVPDFSGRSMRGVLVEMSRLGLQLNAVGSGMAVLQLPAPHSRVTKGARITVQFSRRAN